MVRNLLLPAAVALVVSVVVVVATRPGVEPGPTPPARTSEERRREPVPMPAPGPGPATFDSGTPPAADASDRLRSIEERLDRVEARLESLSSNVVSIEEEVAGPDPKKLDDDELLSRASSLYAQKDYEGSIRYWREMLERDLEPEQRARALQSLGFAYRMTSRPEQSENAFRKLAAFHGEDTPEGMFAMYHVAWCRSNRNDLAGARDLMLRVSNAPHTASIWKLWSRANAADFTVRLGDRERARGMLENMKAELAGDTSPEHARVRGYVERLLADLDG